MKSVKNVQMVTLDIQIVTLVLHNTLATTLLQAARLAAAMKREAKVYFVIQQQEFVIAKKM